MFGTSYDVEAVGDTGEELGGDSRIQRQDTENLEEEAAVHDRLGHSLEDCPRA